MPDLSLTEILLIMILVAFALALNALDSIRTILDQILMELIDRRNE